MRNQGVAAMPLIKIKEKGQLTLPAKIRERHGLDVGDYVEVKEEGNRIILVPQKISDRDPAADAAIATALSEATAGRLSPKFSSATEFEAWLESPEGEAFSRE
jgi:AbrB family looped-hinge helix DNA binding protein